MRGRLVTRAYIAGLVCGVVATLFLIATMSAFEGCSALAPAIDLSVLEDACASTAPTIQASHDCRDVVRAAWAKANGVTIKSLSPEGGADHAVD